jgi:hypothetical protein
VEISVPRAILVQIGKDEPFPLQFAFVPEVDEVAYALPGDPHVIEELSSHFFILHSDFYIYFTPLRGDYRNIPWRVG